MDQMDLLLDFESEPQPSPPPPLPLPTINTKTIIEEDLPMEICCVSWHISSKLLALGAYQLKTDETHVRIGRIYLLKLTQDVPGGFKVINEIEMPGGVLDMKFRGDSLALACSNCICILELEGEGLVLKVRVDISCMGLYLEWMEEGTIVFSDSDGQVCMMEREGKNKEGKEEWKVDKVWKLHENLAWVVHFDQGTNILYSGSDNGTFIASTLKNISDPSKMHKKTYEVGITSITTQNNILALGSYDDTLKLFSVQLTQDEVPNLKLISQVELGGAVWRTLWLSEDKIVAACARNGVSIVDLKEIDKPKVIHTYDKYFGSLCYGLDWFKEGNKGVVGNCYFDNHVVHVWEFDFADLESELSE